jgi:hypothetical protein
VPDFPPLPDRLKNGLLNLEKSSGGTDAEAMAPLRRSLERTIARLASGAAAPPGGFRFQLTGGKALLFQGGDALPLEPARIHQLLNNIKVDLQPGESVDLDGGLAAWVLRPEINLTDTNLRAAEVSLRGMKTGRERDHGAAQAAESAKVRLRARMTQLVTAMQSAQKEGEASASAPLAETPPENSQISPAAANLGIPLPMMDTPPAPEVLAKGLRKMLAAVEGCGFKAAAIGDSGHSAWGSKTPAQRVSLLISSGEAERESLLGAARGEGLQQAPGGGPLNLRFPDAKTNSAALVDLTEASTPYLKQVLTRAQPGAVFNVQVKIATCEDLILLRAASAVPADVDSVIELLRGTAGRIDGAYLKKEAEANGVFAQLKTVWQKAKAQG